MIRRANVGGWVRAEVPPPVADTVPSMPEADIHDEAAEALRAQAYELGWSEGRAALAAEDDARRANAMERIAHAEQALEEARTSLVDLHDGLNDALAKHAATLEDNAVEIAFAVTTALVRPMVLDASLVAAMCAQLAKDEGNAACVLEVSPQDRLLLPASVHGVPIVAVESVARGRCVLRTPRGAMRGDIVERLQAIVDGLRELADASGP